ncbi:MAG: hypothetical protein V4703_06370, partial [Actinomycetota bacterium]
MIGRRTISLEPREVPLGGVRGMSVLRTLPNRDLPTVGAWCFLDRFGPGPVRMRVERRPMSSTVPISTYVSAWNWS